MFLGDYKGAGQMQGNTEISRIKMHDVKSTKKSIKVKKKSKEETKASTATTKCRVTELDT